MRFHFDERKSKRLREIPSAGSVLRRRRRSSCIPTTLTSATDLPEQYRAIGWVGERLYALIFEVREDQEGDYYHLVTLWRATRQEQQLYEEHS
jgi:uncharacterized DUF497 family protein